MEDLKRMPIKVGQLTVRDPDGLTHVFKGDDAGPVAAIGIHDRRLLRRMLVVPDLYLGEAYMDGTLTVEDGTLYDVLDFFAANLMPRVHDSKAVVLPASFHNNVVGKAQSNVAFHYDLDRKLFALFLDKDLQYSCAYFTDPGISLEQAQLNKQKRLGAKLLLKPGMRVLDIGSGFGGLALRLAQAHDVEVVGLTLSEEQLGVSRQRAKDLGLDKRVTFKLLDYREEASRFDRIVSVGMFEHVGQSHFDEFFQKISSLLTADGVSVVHTIGRMAPPGLTSPWLIKYIFPGGYAPSISETVAAVERAGLWITDIEILRLHYAETLKHWHERFQANRAEAAAMYDERFCRMWEYYLVLCEIGYRRLNWMNFQTQMAKSVDAVPKTRDYLHTWNTAK